jgi:hypothetical protein
MRLVWLGYTIGEYPNPFPAHRIFSAWPVIGKSIGIPAGARVLSSNILNTGINISEIVNGHNATGRQDR